ncbi:MAG: transcription antitermination factor NusB [Lachnospiraceae bacterium]|nr:transcription antitermination factor NusB [Lachnospiraceae bacterium]
MGRHELRERIFKLLFRIEFNDISDMPEQVRLFFQDDDNEMSEKNAEYVEKKYEAVLAKKAELDKLISENMEKWDITRIGKVELSIMRLGVYEILFDDDIPVNVAMDEAIELAKEYGQDNSGAFVNAVLSKIAKGNEK